MTLIEQPAGRLETEADGLRYRLDQQSTLVDFGREALGCRDLDLLLQKAAEFAAKGMRTEFSKVLQHLPERDTLLLRAGVGWRPGLVGVNEVPDTPETPAGCSFQTGKRVIANQDAPDQRFRTPDFMVEHGIARAINVPIHTDGKRFGVLEVDSRDDSRFDEDDLSFLQSLANLLGLAIDRVMVEQSLERANQHQQLLTREVSHRVKNSLAMVSALLGLRARGLESEELQQILADTQARIQTIARAHDLLWRGDRVGTVPLDQMICDLAETLIVNSPAHRLNCRIAPLEIDADLAIPLGLMVTELVTNSIKYAYGPEGGEIVVEVEEQPEQLEVRVRDEGRGLPPGTRFDGKGEATLGSRIIASTARQLRGQLDIGSEGPGTEIRFTMPLTETIVR